MNKFEHDLYADTYLENSEKDEEHKLRFFLRNYGLMATFLKGSLVLLMRAGFILIQLSCVPINNVHSVLFHNILDIALNTVVYTVVGYIFSFGNPGNKIIGYSSWIMSPDVDLDNVIRGWASIMATTAIFTTMVVGRIHLLGSSIIFVLISGLITPILIHWIWTSSGWMNNFNLAGHAVSFKDEAGGSLIHINGGLTALIAMLFFGRRIMKLKDINATSITSHAPIGAVAGYFFIIIGFMGVCLPGPPITPHTPENYVAVTMINNLMAASGGLISVILLHYIARYFNFAKIDYWVILRFLQGALAGIVSVSPGVDVYLPMVSLGIGLTIGSVFYYASLAIFHSAMEDYLSIVSVHLISGFISVLIPPLLSTTALQSQNIFIHFSWQLICTLVMIAFVSLLTIVFLMIKLLGILRSSREYRDHNRAVMLMAFGSKRRLFKKILTNDNKVNILEPDNYSVRNAEFPSNNLNEKEEQTSNENDYPLEEIGQRRNNAGKTEYTTRKIAFRRILKPCSPIMETDDDDSRKYHGNDDKQGFNSKAYMFDTKTDERNKENHLKNSKYNGIQTKTISHELDNSNFTKNDLNVINPGVKINGSSYDRLFTLQETTV